MKSVLLKSAELLLDLVYPPFCVSCKGKVEHPEFKYICEKCVLDIIFAQAPCCDTCGYPFWGAVDELKTCPHCVDLRPQFKLGRTVFLLKGTGRQIVHALKYERGLYLKQDILTLLRRDSSIIEFLKDCILIPVPLTLRGLRNRGFNQSRFLADCFAELGNGARVEELLVRKENGGSQTRLSRTERKKNVRNAFVLKEGVCLHKDQKYAVVDDVFTTGATLNACCKVLRKAGIKNLNIITLGHG